MSLIFYWCYVDFVMELSCNEESISLLQQSALKTPSFFEHADAGAMHQFGTAFSHNCIREVGTRWHRQYRSDATLVHADVWMVLETSGAMALDEARVLTRARLKVSMHVRSVTSVEG